MPFDPKNLIHYPLEPGVYLMKNAKGQVIYVGKANCLQTRLKQYFVLGRDTRRTIPLLLKELCTIDVIVVSGEKEALILENTLIKEHRPKFNILLRDDKNYISLSINPNEPWPKLRFGRFTRRPQNGALHFGPYTSAIAARQIFDLMAKLFPLRQCSDAEFKRRTRPCLLYDIRKCVGPCVNKCTKEDYRSYVEGAIHFLQGDTKNVIQMLKVKMEEMAKKLEFEQAAALLRTIEQITHVSQSAHLSFQAQGKNTDVIGFYCKGHQALILRLIFRQGSLIRSEPFMIQETVEENSEILISFLLWQYEKIAELPQEILLPFALAEETALEGILQEIHCKPIKLYYPKQRKQLSLLNLAQKNAKANFIQQANQSDCTKQMLFSLQESLSLQRYPEKIECFDTSNLCGSHLVAASVCFLDGVYVPQKTKLYHVKDIDKPDDYAALHQVLSRRLLRAKTEEEFPDLLIIDGGLGQLHIALEVLRELDIVNVEVIALAKDKARHDKGITLEKIYTPYLDTPISFPFHSPLLFLLQNIRDKAHEKAISFHRKTKRKTTQNSLLDSIYGIGPIKKRNLLQRFGSVQNILLQTEESLLTVPGITKKDITALKKIAF